MATVTFFLDRTSALFARVQNGYESAIVSDRGDATSVPRFPSLELETVVGAMAEWFETDRRVFGGQNARNLISELRKRS